MDFDPGLDAIYKAAFLSVLGKRHWIRQLFQIRCLPERGAK